MEGGGNTSIQFVEMVIERLNALEKHNDELRDNLRGFLEARGPTFNEIMEHDKKNRVTSISFFRNGGAQTIQFSEEDEYLDIYETSSEGSASNS